MVFRPCIDIHAGKVKQIVGSSLTGDNQQLVTNFEATMDAADFARCVGRLMHGVGAERHMD